MGTEEHTRDPNELVGSFRALAFAAIMVGALAVPPSPIRAEEVQPSEAVFAFGQADFLGSTAGVYLAQPVAGLAATPGGDGYWEVALDGGIFNYGRAPFAGSAGDIALNEPIVDLEATPTGHGYWMLAADGGIFAFGDAGFFGSAGGFDLVAPMVALAATPSGRGYWAVGSDGGVYSYGDAKFFGSPARQPLNTRVVDIAATPDGRGYWLAAAGGGIFAYGSARFFGAAAGLGTDDPAVALGAAPDERGYWVATRRGRILPFGEARSFGAAADEHLGRPVIDLATHPSGKGYWLLARDVAVCRNDHWRAEFPSDWTTNPPEAIPGCSRFGPGEAGSPAMIIRASTAPYREASQPDTRCERSLSRYETLVGGHAATRLEGESTGACRLPAGQRIYRYVIRDQHKLRVDIDQAARALAGLARFPLLRELDGRFRYSCEHQPTAATVDALAALYPAFRMAIVSLIFSRASGPIRDFSEAFRLQPLGP